MTNDIEINQALPSIDSPEVLDIWAHPSPIIQYGAELRYEGKVYKVLSLEPQPSKINGHLMTRFTGKIIS